MTDQVLNLRIALNGILVYHANGARFGDTANVIACQINQHQVLGSFFRIMQKVFGKSAVVLHINSSGASSRNRSNRRDPSSVTQLLPHQNFRRSSDNKVVSKVVEVHVRRWIETSQRTVQRNRVFSKTSFDALPDLHLHAVTGQDVVLGFSYSLQIVFLGKRTLCFVNNATGGIRSFHRTGQRLLEPSDAMNGR